MPSCAVATCKNTNRKTKGTDIKYFGFPKTEALANQWINACSRRDKINLKYARVCSNHFKSDSFEIPMRQRLLQYYPKKYRCLKSDAVPEINLNVWSQNSSNGEERSNCLNKKQQSIVLEILTESISTSTSHQEPILTEASIDEPMLIDGRILAELPGISDDEIPHDPAWRKQWLKLLRFDEDKPMPQRALVCEKHFSNYNILRKENGAKYLRNNASPMPIPVIPRVISTADILTSQPQVDENELSGPTGLSKMVHTMDKVEVPPLLPEISHNFGFTTAGPLKQGLVTVVTHVRQDDESKKSENQLEAQSDSVEPMVRQQQKDGEMDETVFIKLEESCITDSQTTSIPFEERREIELEEMCREICNHGRTLDEKLFYRYMVDLRNCQNNLQHDITDILCKKREIELEDTDDEVTTCKQIKVETT